jgi:chromosome segregation ATPase
MTLADDVAELEENYDNLKAEVRVLEESLDEVEGELEDVTNQLARANEFREWVQHVYPEIIRDYDSVKVIEEMANGI